MLKLLFDADMIVYEACSSVEKEINWGDGLWTLHADENEAEAQVDEKIANITNTVLSRLGYDGAYEIILCFSDPKSNFRRKILSTYKANRDGKRKPICYNAVVKWCEDNYYYQRIPSLEADDVVGILATQHEGHEVHISGDKDFKSIPGCFYDYIHGELLNITEEEADHWFLTQCLIGDPADNYSGCPGIGIKTAEKIFKKEGYTWNTVLKQFEKMGMTEEEALQQARVARILRRTNVDSQLSPILWTPTSSHSL